MAYWLMKSEPEVFSIEDLRRNGVSGWDSVRNYQARNFMKAMKKGDQALFYHSNAEPPGVAGLMGVAREAYPDPTQFDPKALADKPIWFHVDVEWEETFPRLLSLEVMRGTAALADMELFRRSRLSVQPVTPRQWSAVLKAAR